MNNRNLSLKEIVACAVNGLEAGVDSKEDAINSILNFIDNNYTENADLDIIKTELFELTDEQGKKVKIAGVRLEDLKAS